MVPGTCSAPGLTLSLIALPYNNMERVADRDELLYEAVMLAEVATRTREVFTVNVALVAPAGMNTLDGTLAAELSLESATCAPPEGAGPLNVTVPVEDPSSPTITVGFNVSEDTVGRGGGGTGFTVSEAVFVPLA